MSSLVDQLSPDIAADVRKWVDAGMQLTKGQEASVRAVAAGLIDFEAQAAQTQMTHRRLGSCGSVFIERVMK